MHPAQIVVCTSTLKCGLTPSTTQVIGASMKKGSMISIKTTVRVGISQSGQNIPCFFPVKRGLGRKWELFILGKIAYKYREKELYW